MKSQLNSEPRIARRHEAHGRAIFGVAAGAEMQKPLAIAVIGGLSYSTVFTLFFVPLLYFVMQRVSSKVAAQS